MGEHPLNVIHQENINFVFVTYYDYRQDQKKQKKSKDFECITLSKAENKKKSPFRVHSICT